MNRTFCDLCSKETQSVSAYKATEKLYIKIEALNAVDSRKADVCDNCLRKEVAAAFELSLREPVLDDDFIRHHLWEMFTACKSSQLDTVISICQMLERHLREYDGEKRQEGPLESLNL